VTEDVVLLHPIGLDSRCWRWLPLAGAVALDLPGHGARAVPSFTEVAAAADDVAARLGDPVHMVGLSLGGMVAQHLALRHPERVRSLLIACSVPKGDAAVMEERAVEFERDLNAAAAATVDRWLIGAEDDGPARRYALEQLRATGAAGIAAGWRAIGRHDVVERLAAIDVPVSIVTGTRDGSVSPAAVEAFLERVPLVRHDVLDGPHMLQLAAPEAFAQAVQRHCRWAAEATRAG
jgi:pimeloyl-ACP methyl ester carboxylesterase